MAKKIIYCDACGCEISDVNTCSMYKAGSPYYETIYICEECHNNGTSSSAVMESYGLQHVDMENGEAL